MKRKSVMILLSMLMASSVLTACDKSLKIGPITLGKPGVEEGTEAPESNANSEYLFGDIQLGTVLTATDCENILIANGIDPTQCVSYIFSDGTGTMLYDWEFTSAGTYNLLAMYQVGEEVREIPFVVNVIDTGVNQEVVEQPEAPVEQESTEDAQESVDGFLGYEVEYVGVDNQRVDTSVPFELTEGFGLLAEGDVINAAVKEDDTGSYAYTTSENIDYEQSAVIYTGIALASENADTLKLPEGTEFVIYGYVDMSSLKSSDKMNSNYFVYLPTIDESVLDIEDETKVHEASGVEYNAGRASAIYKQYAPDLSALIEQTIITATFDESVAQAPEVTQPENNPTQSAPEVSTSGDVTASLTHEIQSPSHKSKYPNVYKWPSTGMTFSRWDMRITEDTEINKIVILEDGTIFPAEPTEGEVIQPGTSKPNSNTTQSSNQQVTEPVEEVKEYTLNASYTSFKLYEEDNYDIRIENFDNGVVNYTYGANTYKAYVIPKTSLLTYLQVNMFKDTTSLPIPVDSSAYSIISTTLIESDVYDIQRYDIEYIDMNTGFKESRLYAVTVIPKSAPTDILFISGLDVCSEFDDTPMLIAKNCIEVIQN